MHDPKGSGHGIVAMGAALPAQVRTNDFWREDPIGRKALERKAFTTAAEQAGSGEVDPEIARLLTDDPFNGARERRVLDPRLASSDLETAAARAALDAGGFAPEDIDALLVYSILPDELHPQNHALVAHKLGLREDVIALSVDASCGSFPPQLYLADRMIDGQRVRNVLIVQSSVMSRLMDYASPASFNAGDGATACVVGEVGAGRGIVGYRQHTRGDLHGSLRVFSPSNPSVPWYDSARHERSLAFGSGDAGAAAELIKRSASHCRHTCGSLLSDHGIAANDITFFATGQPTAWFPRACADSLGISPTHTLDTFATYAHLMPCSPLLNLSLAQSRRLLHNDALVLGYAPGVGSLHMAVLMIWTDAATRQVELSFEEGTQHAVAV